MGTERCRSTVHNWVQKPDLQPTDGADRDHVAVDETVIKLNDERFWLYAAADPDTNRLLHMTLFPARNPAITGFAEFREKYLVDNVLRTPHVLMYERDDMCLVNMLFLVGSAPWL